MASVERPPSHHASRSLTPLEHGLIAAMITDECPDAGPLRMQLETARVAGPWPPAGSPSVDLLVADEAPVSALEMPVLPMDAHVYDVEQRYLGELIVWLSKGRICALEYAWVTDEMPTALPGKGLVQVTPALR